MLKLKTCNICGKRFKSNVLGRLQLVKRKKKGKVEVWICPACVPLVKERLKDLNLLK